MDEVTGDSRAYDWGIRTFINKQPHVYLTEVLNINTNSIQREPILNLIHFIRINV